jgi:hypothetical protein
LGVSVVAGSKVRGGMDAAFTLNWRPRRLRSSAFAKTIDD